MSSKSRGNDKYLWPKVMVTDCFGDQVSISEGTLEHVMIYHPGDFGLDLADRIETVLVSPKGGVYYNSSDHAHPERMLYVSEVREGKHGRPEVFMAVVDKVNSNPNMVITSFTNDYFTIPGECIRNPEGE